MRGPAEVTATVVSPADLLDNGECPSRLGAPSDRGLRSSTTWSRLGGVATRRELLHIASRTDLARALADGSIHRPRRGRYVLPQVEQSRRVAHELSGVGSPSALLP